MASSAYSWQMLTKIFSLNIFSLIDFRWKVNIRFFFLKKKNFIFLTSTHYIQELGLLGNASTRTRKKDRKKKVFKNESLRRQSVSSQN